MYVFGIDQVQIQRFMEKKKTKKDIKKTSDDDEDTNDVSVATEDENYLRKKVSELVRKGKIKVAGKIMNAYDCTKPWGTENQAKVFFFPFQKTSLNFYRYNFQCIYFKVGSRLIEMLIEVAYIQPPVDQSGAGFIDIRPAFRHVQNFSMNSFQK